MTAGMEKHKASCSPPAGQSNIRRVFLCADGKIELGEFAQLLRRRLATGNRDFNSTEPRSQRSSLKAECIGEQT